MSPLQRPTRKSIQRGCVLFSPRVLSFAFSRILAEKRGGTGDELRYWIIPEAPGSPREPSI